jgi:hypothetical protein
MEELQVSPDVKDRLALALKDYAPEIELEDSLLWSLDSRHIPCHRIPIDRNSLPVPELIQYMLVKVLGFPDFGPDEKIRWLIPFSYKGIQCTLAYQKFGVRLYIAKNGVAAQDSLQYMGEIVGKLNRAARIIEEQVLNPYAMTQISKGNITVANQYGRLDDMYRYFRQQASRSFSNKPEPAQKGDEFFGTLVALSSMLGTQTDGFYNALAMLDAYFSRLEHLLVVVLPFINFSATTNNLVDIISSQWADKYKRVFDINSDRSAKQYYDKLYDIKERFRNTFAHGGFEKKGASLYFHLPEIGTLPAQLTNIKNSPHFNFLPIDDADFNNVCSLFDQFDEWLKSGKARFGVLYAESGLDVPFDAESIREHEVAMNSEDDFQNLLDYRDYLSDMHTNMEY